MTMLSAHARRLLLREFADWAEGLGLSTDRHEARFRGVVRGALVEIETGVRDSNLYRAVVVIHCESGLTAQVLREGAEQSSDPPLIARLRSVLRRRQAIVSIRIDRERITVRMHPGSWPAEVDRVVDDVLSAVQSGWAEQGPYR